MINLENATERIKEYLEDENLESLQEILNGYQAADLAEIFQDMKSEDRLTCFKLIDEDKAAELLEYLIPQLQVEILGEIDKDLASRLILKMPQDAVADFLSEVEDEESEDYLDKLPEKVVDELRELMTYKEDTAGGLMNPKVLTVQKDMTVSDALNFIRDKAENDNVELYYIYVVDRQNHLLGVISLRKLLTSHNAVKISDIMTSDIVRLHVDDPQDAVADIFMKYQFNALPVVDLYNRLKGMVTWDDAQDVAEEETTEEILQSSGITTAVVDEDDIISGNIFNAIRARCPWLLITLIGEFIAVNVANYYNFAIDVLPVVAIFMPLLAGLGGNIGTQSITIMVRGLSTGQITLSMAMHHIFRELRIGVMIGLFFGLMVMLVTWGWQHNVKLGIVVGMAMVINMAMATIIGTVTPFALKAVKVDPAVASGPVIATTIDVIGLAVYFSLVTVCLIKIT